MTTRRLLRAVLFTASYLATTLAQAQTSGSGSSSSSPSGGGLTGNAPGGPADGKVSAAVSSGWSRYYPFYVVTATPSGIVYSYFPPPFGAPAPVPIYVDRGTIAPPPPPGLIKNPQPDRPEPQARRGDPHRSIQIMTLGDRMFRIGNWKRAEDRYLQAAKIDPGAAAPLVRLAQIALVREHYREAADRFREAEIVEPGWVAAARDVQAIYAEPADFARHVAKLEAHLHTHPDDRDAWLVLGAEWFLSGREGRAADVFARLDDPHRRHEPVLDAFLEATNQRERPLQDGEPAADPNPERPFAGDPFRPPDRRP